jgi:hypothetical protein
MGRLEAAGRAGGLDGARRLHGRPVRRGVRSARRTPEGTREALLILRAASAEEIVERLAEDPWTTDGHLVTKQISPWQIRLGSLG